MLAAGGDRSSAVAHWGATGGETSMRWFRRTARRAPTIESMPEFGVRVTLRRGDKIVRRDGRGVIHVLRITEERVDLRDVQTARARR